jgi:6-phosphofructokinase 1
MSVRRKILGGKDMEPKIKKIAIITNGGDAPGLNAVIRAIVKTARTYGVESYGFIEGYQGLLDNNYVKLDLQTNANGLLTRGGTIIGTSNNTNVFNYKVVKEDGTVEYQDLSDKCVQNLKDDGFDCLFTLGGDGTQKSSRDFSLKGVRCIGVPKTIDNDVAHTDMTFGYNTAVQVATDALDRIHTTAESHHRIMILEVMGRYAGWLALESAIAGGADVALIPEIPYDINSVIAKVNERKARGKLFTIIVVSEGAMPKDGTMTVKKTYNDGSGLDNVRLGGIGDKLAAELEELTGFVTRSTTLGYVQRGGTPTAFDRVLSTKYGTKAMELALNGIFNVLVTYKDGKMSYVPLEDVVGNNKVIGAASGNTRESNIRKVPLDCDLIDVARKLGMSLGD